MSVVIEFCCVTQQELDRMYRDPEWMHEFIEAYQDNEERSEDPDGFIDSAWEGIQSLLNAASVPIDLQMGGDSIDEECLFWGWSAEEVKKTAQILWATPFEKLAVHFDSAVSDEHELEYLRQNYVTLVNFFDITATKGNAALMEFNI